MLVDETCDDIGHKPLRAWYVYAGGSDFEISHAAEACAREQGFNIGPMEGSYPRALSRRAKYIAKWSNIPRSEFPKIEGLILCDDFRNGTEAVVVELRKEKTMTINDMMRLISKSYDDGYTDTYWDYGNSRVNPQGTGDTLAEFIVREINDTFEPDNCTDDQLEEAIRVMRCARNQIDEVLAGLNHAANLSAAGKDGK